MTALFDRTLEDVGNIVQLEHVNLSVPDQLLATRFYVTTLGLTRDPYLNTGAEVMWVNVGATQFHLPQGAAQRLRGTLDLVIPDLQALLGRLRGAVPPLQHTAFAFEEHADRIDVSSPWGNRLRCFEPGAARFGPVRLGIARIGLDVPPHCAPAIARFYQDIFGAPTEVLESPGGARTASIRVGPGQQLEFTETSAPLPAYDGHHIQIYVADFSAPHRRLKALGLVSEESSQHQFRFVHIVDPQTGAPCYQLEHEVRSLTHPLFRRPLVNRNPAQTSRHYQPGADSL